MQHRLFLTLTNGVILPFKEVYVSRRHAEAGIVGIQERGGIDCLDVGGTVTGQLPLKEIKSFDICPVGTDGCAMPQSFKPLYLR